MRKRWIAPIALLLIVAAGVLLYAGRAPGPWTTESREALAEFERGLEALMKRYRKDAADHFRRALELDPEFVAARFFLLDLAGDREWREDSLERLRAADLDRLSDRERFLVEYVLADRDGGSEARHEVLEAFATAHPEDPYALFTAAGEAWGEQDWPRAERLFRKLREADPNWVLAQNYLGYLAEAQGNFQEAEELFETYKYIAPDQANPHDSLGELLTILGRYEEARQSFEEALRVKPDFCTSYAHLFDLFILEGQPDEVLPLFDGADERCQGKQFEKLRCQAGLWKYLFSEDFDAAFRDDNADCLDRLDPADALVHRLALLSGRTERALDAEQTLAERIAGRGEREYWHQIEQARLLHMQGVRAAVEGRYDEATDFFFQADEQFFYWGQGQGIFKLYNRLNLAYCLAQSGSEAAAQMMVEEVRQVNPDFADVYPGIGRLLTARPGRRY